MTAAAAKAAGELTGAITVDGVEYPVVVEGGATQSPGQKPSWSIIVNGRSFKVELEGDDTVLVDDIAYDVSVDGETLRAGDESYSIQVSGLSTGRPTPAEVARPARTVEAVGGAGVITAIMPGQITRVMVEEGQQVGEGEAVCVLEAMKMENELRADRAGVVKAVHVRPGEDVVKDQVLVEVD
jgi:biotin carboxyl carrier protein